MLKKVFILLGIALILTGCTNEFPQVGTSSSYAPPLYAGEPNINLKMITPIDGALETSDTGNEKGYYHLKFNNNQSANITYIDFNTKAHVFLNSDISSTYSNSTDPSWLPFGAVSLFWNNDKLYCVTPSNVSADALSTQIVQMDANGTNSKPLVSIPSNQSMLRGIATDGDNLYTTLETVKKNGEAYFSFSKISLSDGTITELLQLDTTDVLFGVYKDKCYFKSLKNDTESIPGEWELYSYSLSSGEKHIVARETPYSSIGGISGKFYYYLNLEQGKLFSLDLETGELSTVADNLDLGTTPETSRFYGFWDNHFMYINFITNDDYSLSYDVYGIDLESHAITNVSLMCNYHGNRYIWLQWETPTEFLVINGENRYTQTLYAPDGTTYQEEQIEPQFALIKKEDYWNSVPNYIPIESLQN